MATTISGDLVKTQVDFSPNVYDVQLDRLRLVRFGVGVLSIFGDHVCSFEIDTDRGRVQFDLSEIQRMGYEGIELHINSLIDAEFPEEET